MIILLKQTAAATLLAPALLLHDLANLDRRVEILGGAAVKADGLALVELGLAVIGGNTLFLAILLEAASC